MKKHNVLNTALTVLICSAAIVGLAYSFRQQNQASSRAAAPEVIQAFYDSWVNYPGNPLADKYYQNSGILTPGLAGKIDGILASFDQGGYDPILCAQDKPESFEIKQAPGAESTSYIVEEKFGSAIKTVGVEAVSINNAWKISDINCSSEATGQEQTQTLVGDYIREHLSELSPQKEVLGGKFYLTKIVFMEGSRALVEYEDGHIALAALAEYAVSQNGQVAIKTFKDLAGNFQQSGTLVKDSPGLKPNSWHLNYERPGRPALTVELAFNAGSVCINGNQAGTCLPAALVKGSPVKLTGRLSGGRLEVYTLSPADSK